MHPPSHLIELQEKFGKILLGKLPTSAIFPKERTEIYYSAYLTRLSSVLGKQFPTLPALLGEKAFQSKVAWPYLAKRGIKDWRLEIFGLGLAAWVKKESKAWLSPLLIPMAEIDEAFLLCEFPEERQGFLKKEVQVVESLYPLIELRKALLQKEVVPSFQKKKRAFVIYSDANGRHFSLEVDPFEGRLLKLLTMYSLDRALELLVQDKSLALSSLESLLPVWSAKWGSLRWIADDM